MASGADAPSPINMPRRRGIPAATSVSRPGAEFSRRVPNRGRPASRYYLDTGIFYSVCREERCCHRIKQHYAGRLCTTDIILEEVRHRAASKVGHERQLEKNAAADSLRRLFNIGFVEVVDTLQTDDDMRRFDAILNQLRSLEASNSSNESNTIVGDKHAGEASAIVCCVREIGEDIDVVFLTNDGNASKVAAAYQVDARHFAHVLQELVCAELFTAEQAFVAFGVADKVTKIPTRERPSSASHFSCAKNDGNCPACV